MEVEIANVTRPQTPHYKHESIGYEVSAVNYPINQANLGKGYVHLYIV